MNRWHPTPFVPRRGLQHPDVQTIVSHFLPRASTLGRGLVRDVPVEADVVIRCHVHLQKSHQAAATLVAVHGLEGSVDAQYMVGLSAKAFAAGMNVVRMNMRNCGEGEQLTSTLYHSGLSSDLDRVVRDVIAEYSLRHVGVVGYSMGGNLVLKLAGEWGASAPPEVFAVATVSPAMDLSASSAALHAWRNRVYELTFLVSLARRFHRKRKGFPERYQDFKLLGITSLRDFDDRVVARAFGFADAEDYYAQSASARRLSDVRVPALILHASDDPFIRVLPETRATLANNPHIRFVETRHGGHCAFLAQPSSDDGRWAETEVVSFLLHTHHHPLHG